MVYNNPYNNSGFVIFGRRVIGRDEIAEVVDTLRSGWLSTGPKVERFEEMFRQYTGSRYACALSSCSAALHLSLLAIGIGAGDEVITTPFTYAATVNAILHVGAKPVFVDIERNTFNINPFGIEEKITHRTKAIIPVHFAGRPCNMKKIMYLAKKYGLRVIEDAAHALGAKYHEKKIGNIGDITCFSFYANKNISTGEGGMLTTNNPEWERKARVLSNNGLDSSSWERYRSFNLNNYKVVSSGYKYNMTDLQAAIGIHQMKRLEKGLIQRESTWGIYDKAFKGLPVNTPLPVQPQIRHARHIYTLIVDSKAKLTRDELRKALFKEKIGTGVHFIPLHLQPYYQKNFGYKLGDFENAEFVSERIVSLPLSFEAGCGKEDTVTHIIRKLLNN